MAFQLSPGVNVSEIDLTTIVPSVASSIGAHAGIFAWGPANEIVTIGSEVLLQERFGSPDNTNFEYWFTAANFLAYGNNLKLVRAVNNDHATGALNAAANVGGAILIENDDDYDLNHGTAANTSVGPFAAKYPGARGNSLRISICPSANAFSQNLSVGTAANQIRANAITIASTPQKNVIPINSPANTHQPFITRDKVSIDGGTTYFDVVSANAFGITIAQSLTADITGSPAVLKKWQYHDDFKVAPGTSDYVANKGGSGDEMHVIVVDEDSEFSGTANTILNKFAFVSKASDAKTGTGETNFYKEVINKTSESVWWTAHQNGGTNWGSGSATAFTEVQVPFSASLVGGADGTTATANVVTAFDNFADADSVDISLVMTGPGDQTVATHVIDNIAVTRKDCIAFVSPRRADVVNNSGNEVTDIKTYRNLLTSTSFAFLDSGYKYQYDKYNDVFRYVPLNGDIAGLCVRTDIERDAWFSPGGLNRGIIKNVTKLAFNPTKTNRDDLYTEGVNPVVAFQGEGTVLFGDKTMQSKPSAFDRINVRRLFLVLERAIGRAAQNVLFEFNDEFTRAEFVNVIEPVLRDVKGRRGITDFRIVADETVNTPAVIDRNEFIANIFIKPARSINYVTLNFVAVRTGVDFEEVVGTV